MTESLRMKQAAKIFRDRNFLFLGSGTVLSSFGDAAYFILIGWFVIDVTGSQLTLGTVLTLGAVPRLVLMLAGGVVADRMSRKRLLVGSLLTRAGLLVLFALWLALSSHGHLQLWAVYGLAVAFGVVDAFYWPASGSIVPQVVSDEDLPVANSFVQTAQQISVVGGPLIAAGLLWLKNYPLMFLVMAGLFGSGALCQSFLRLRMNGPGNLSVGDTSVHQEKQKGRSPSALHEVMQGLHYVRKERILWLIMLFSMVINLFFFGPINVGLPALVHHLNWSGSLYGELEASVGVGAVVGGLATGWLNGLRGHFHWIAPMATVMGFSLGTVGLIHQPVVDLLLMGLAGLSMSVVDIPILIYIQTITERGLLGRVMSLLTLMSIGLSPVSYALSGVILQQGWLSDAWLIFVGGGVIGVFSLVLLILPEFRRIEDHPRWQEAAVSKDTGSTME
ncbi:MFS transporter [Alicyclobacillaceae bacterium I2511]|nr:MFS transporter [Alicyclobacillaceae bacterium I2511]